MIVAIRTDKPEAELYLVAQDGAEQGRIVWQAHRELSNTIFHKLNQLLEEGGVSFADLTGLVVFKGPGSFTGLRIGITVANTLAYALATAVVGETGEDWLSKGAKRLSAGASDRIVMPEYGAEANITKPRK